MLSKLAEIALLVAFAALLGMQPSVIDIRENDNGTRDPAGGSK